MKNMKKLWNLVIILVLGIIINSCGGNDASTPADPITVTQNVKVSFPAFVSGNTMNLAPTYAPDGAWQNHFSGADFDSITYTFTVSGPSGFNYTYDSGTGFEAKIADNGGYQPFNTYTFTQTFKNDKGTVIGNQIIKIYITLSGFSILKNTNDENLVPQLIPSVHFNLSKEVQP